MLTDTPSWHSFPEHVNLVKWYDFHTNTWRGTHINQVTACQRFVNELATYSCVTFCCTSRGSWGKLVRPAYPHRIVSVPQPLQPVGQDWASVTHITTDNTAREQSSTWRYVWVLLVTAILWPVIQTQCSYSLCTLYMWDICSMYHW